jgi:hypothetical protein
MSLTPEMLDVLSRNPVAVEALVRALQLGAAVNAQVILHLAPGRPVRTEVLIEVVPTSPTHTLTVSH